MILLTNLLLLSLVPAPCTSCITTWPVLPDFSCVNASARLCWSPARVCPAISGFVACGPGGDCCPASYSCSFTDTSVPQCSKDCSTAASLGASVTPSQALYAGAAIAAMLLLCCAAWLHRRYCAHWLGRYVVGPQHVLERVPFNGGEAWHSSAFQCSAPPGGAPLQLYAAACCCLAAGEVAAAAQQSFWGACCAALCSPCGGVWYLSINRNMLSMRLNASDGRSTAARTCCLLWCLPCFLAQMLNHLLQVEQLQLTPASKRGQRLPPGQRLTQVLHRAAAAGPGPSQAGAGKGSSWLPARQAAAKWPATHAHIAALGLVLSPWHYGRGAVVAGWEEVGGGGGPGELQAAGLATVGCLLVEVNGLPVHSALLQEVAAALQRPARPLTLTFLLPHPQPRAEQWGDDRNPRAGLQWGSPAAAVWAGGRALLSLLLDALLCWGCCRGRGGSSSVGASASTGSSSAKVAPKPLALPAGGAAV